MNPPGLSALQGARVVVAMSGGVDSAVTAALLKRAGCEVVGITLQLYDHGAASGRKGACCAGADIRDARRVAEHLGIAHYVLDYEARFRGAVMDAFADSYRAGETPVPCVLCNQRVKFADLMQTARDLGAAALATGHYVRRVEGADGPELHRAADEGRDQSYFLFATTRDQLDFLRFPLGDMTKPQTRALAASLALPVAEKPDSQDICFVPSGRYAGVVERLRPGAAEPGEIAHVDGRVLGRHAGIIHYTVGQRRGLGLVDPQRPGEPLFVVRLEPAARRVVVGPRAALGVASFALRGVNWLGGVAPDPAGIALSAKVRSTTPAVPATLFADGPGDGAAARVVPAAPLEGVAPGQACVLYDGTHVLGGGWIAREGAAGARPAAA